MSALLRGLSQWLQRPWSAVVLMLWPAIVLLPLATAPLDVQITHASTDDTFYYYAWARNLADGQGPTADGVTPTNGVQPLWALMLGGVATVFHDPESLVDAALVLALALDLLAGALCIRIGFHLAGPSMAWLVGAIFARLLVHAQWALLSGMEISLNVAVTAALGLAALVVHRAGRWPSGWRAAALGTLAAAYALVRVENVVPLATTVLVHVCVRLLRGRGLFPDLRPKQSLALMTPVLVLTGSYLLYNRLVFGALLPGSGAIKLLFSARLCPPWPEGAAAWQAAIGIVQGAIQNISRPLAWTTPLPSIPSGRWDHSTLALGACAALVIFLAPRGRRRATAGAVGLAALLLVPQQLAWAAFLCPNYREYAVWYLAGPAMAIVIAEAWITHRVVAWLPGPPAIRRVAGMALVTAITVPVLWRAGGAYAYVASAPPDLRHPALAPATAARWADRHLPADAVVGSFNSGVMHYVADRPILNLDGRVDDGELVRLLRGGGSILDYICARGITHVIDRPTPGLDPIGTFWTAALESGTVLMRFPIGKTDDAEIVVLQLDRALCPSTDADAP